MLLPTAPGCGGEVMASQVQKQHQLEGIVAWQVMAGCARLAVLRHQLLSASFQTFVFRSQTGTGDPKRTLTCSSTGSVILCSTQKATSRDRASSTLIGNEGVACPANRNPSTPTHHSGTTRSNRPGSGMQRMDRPHLSR